MLILAKAALPRRVCTLVMRVRCCGGLLTLQQWRIRQGSQRLTHDEQEEVRAELLAALAEGGVAESHAEKVAQALGEATGKRQRMRDQTHDDLPGENLAARALMRLHIAGLQIRFVPVQPLENAAHKIGRLNWGNRDEGGWRVHPMSVNQENTKYSNYSLTALGLNGARDVRKIDSLPPE